MTKQSTYVCVWLCTNLCATFTPLVFVFVFVLHQIIAHTPKQTNKQSKHVGTIIGTCTDADAHEHRDVRARRLTDDGMNTTKEAKFQDVPCSLLKPGRFLVSVWRRVRRSTGRGSSFLVRYRSSRRAVLGRSLDTLL